jgi:hypothetical protein
MQVQLTSKSLHLILFINTCVARDLMRVLSVGVGRRSIRISYYVSVFTIQSKSRYSSMRRHLVFIFLSGGVATAFAYPVLSRAGRSDGEPSRLSHSINSMLKFDKIMVTVSSTSGFSKLRPARMLIPPPDEFLVVGGAHRKTSKQAHNNR